MDNYMGAELLDLTFDAAAPAGETRSAKLAVVSSAVGPRRVYDKRGFPVRTRSVTMTGSGPQGIAGLRGFIRRRQGRVVPFWLSSGQADLVASANSLAGTNLMGVKGTSYAALFATGARSHLLINGLPMKVTAAVAQVDGTTAVTLQSNLGTALAAGTQLSFLLLYRFAADEAPVEFSSPDFASSTVDLVELPRET